MRRHTIVCTHGRHTHVRSRCGVPSVMRARTWRCQTLLCTTARRRRRLNTATPSDHSTIVRWRLERRHTRGLRQWHHRARSLELGACANGTKKRRNARASATNDDDGRRGDDEKCSVGDETHARHIRARTRRRRANIHDGRAFIARNTSSFRDTRHQWQRRSRDRTRWPCTRAECASP